MFVVCWKLLALPFVHVCDAVSSRYAAMAGAECGKWGFGNFMGRGTTFVWCPGGPQAGMLYHRIVIFALMQEPFSFFVVGKSFATGVYASWNLCGQSKASESTHRVDSGWLRRKIFSGFGFVVTTTMSFAHPLDRLQQALKALMHCQQLLADRWVVRSC